MQVRRTAFLLFLGLGLGVFGCGKKASDRTGTGMLDGGPGGAGGGNDASVVVDAPVTETARSDAGVDAPTSIRAFDDCLTCEGIFTPTVESCGLNDACSTLRACFHLTPDLAVCGLAANRAATACGNGASSHPDDCGCNGLACPADQACVQVYDYPPANARDAGAYNTCVDSPCTSPSDCADGTVCRPGEFIRAAGYPDSAGRPATGRCFRTACQSDSECDNQPGGRCALVYHNNGNGGLDIFGVRCVYADPDSPPSGLEQAWCSGTRVLSLRSLGTGLGIRFHTCPDLAR